MLHLKENQELRVALWKGEGYELVIRTFDTYNGATKHIHPTGILMPDMDMDTMKQLRSYILTAFAEEVVQCRRGS
jgi:hypothetical protein